MSNFTDQQLSSSSSNSSNMAWLQGIGRSRGIQCVSDDNEHIYSPFTGDDTKQIQRHIENSLQHERNTIQVRPDGTVIITPHFRQLPNEIQARNINHVDEASQRHPYLIDDSRPFDQRQDPYTCTLVNKRFHLEANPSLRQEPVLDVEPTNLQPLLDCLAATEQPLRYHTSRLLLKNTTCTDTELLLLMPHIRHLETLSIKNVDSTNDFSPITDTSVQHLPRYCSQLTSLEIHNIHLSGATIRSIARHCRQLTELTVHPGEGLMPLANTLQHRKTENDLTTPWPHLKKLSLGHCYDVKHIIFIYFIEGHPHLQCIRLEDATLKDESLTDMAFRLRDLRELVLVRVNRITSGGVRRFIQKAQRLVRVECRECHQIVARNVLETYDGDEDHLHLNEHDIAKIRGTQGTGNVH
ncbi:hypothetical protein BCR42DRAFT_426176 [Absidia repens]|uniref:F-box domain-containing protein n=1 Tax=Absidia repens TaxID=90262 RepID=A0A1X2I1M8_9FUNG|nr:hypothetical protein BCR42DRAFT_426176 [Absidia repens]